MSKHLIAALILVLMLSLWAPAALAGAAAPSRVPEILAAQGNQGATGSAEARPGDSTFTSVLRMLFSFAVVVAIAYGASLMLRRLNVGRSAARAGAIRIVETIPLGPSRTLHLIAVGSRRLLIGATAQQVTLLEDVTGHVEDQEAAPPAPLAPQTFLHHLQTFARPGRGPAVGSRGTEAEGSARQEPPHEH